MKNRSNEIGSNEIRIRRELPVQINKNFDPIVFKSVYDDDFRLLDIPESASRRPRADLGLSQLQSLKWNPKPKKSFKSEFSDLVTSLFQKLIFISRLLITTSKLPPQFQRSFNVANKKDADDSTDYIHTFVLF